MRGYIDMEKSLEHDTRFERDKVTGELIHNWTPEEREQYLEERREST